MELEFHAIAETTASRILRKRPGVVQVFLIILHEPFRLPSPNETSGAGGRRGRGDATCDSRTPRSRDSIRALRAPVSGNGGPASGRGRTPSWRPVAAWHGPRGVSAAPRRRRGRSP